VAGPRLGRHEDEGFFNEDEKNEKRQSDTKEGGFFKSPQLKEVLDPAHPEADFQMLVFIFLLPRLPLVVLRSESDPSESSWYLTLLSP